MGRKKYKRLQQEAMLQPIAKLMLGAALPGLMVMLGAWIWLIALQMGLVKTLLTTMIVLGLLLVFVLWTGKIIKYKSKRKRSLTLTGKLAAMIPEEYRAYINEIRYRLLVKQKCPKWWVKVVTIKCLLEVFWGTIRVRVENIWLSINRRS
ncbi:MAG: hypothetical protein F6K36_16940 [Symploca sp. SIO3C6]|uniref:Uncharacterized protein n=1 Tax=Symploca sp. SIO1C4 TaxID=2607765 RepID=A0A6B3NFA5_9CYAN|nr:hypothetical protein [Symploca sp. SIO3C6]NER30303.1 hypothetical protein [Symploca sp. SIO1C4]